MFKWSHLIFRLTSVFDNSSHCEGISNCYPPFWIPRTQIWTDLKHIWRILAPNIWMNLSKINGESEKDKLKWRLFLIVWACLISSLRTSHCMKQKNVFCKNIWKLLNPSISNISTIKSPSTSKEWRIIKSWKDWDHLIKLNLRPSKMLKFATQHIMHENMTKYPATHNPMPKYKVDWEQLSD